MFIEKSPNHPNYKRNQLINSNKFEDIKKNKINKTQNETFSLLKWIKGTVNPLQNLPIISGIYSSINSEKKESDRDIIQNSLGGFLYGGPIGAIAGFGNWIFNKAFDKTPTELFFDITGISNIWENKENKSKVIAQLNKNKKPTPIFKQEGINVTSVKELNSQTESVNTTKKAISSKNEKLSNTNNKQHMIEFDYPKWIPDDQLEIQRNSKTLDLSLINKQYETQKQRVNTLNIKA